MTYRNIRAWALASTLLTGFAAAPAFAQDAEEEAGPITTNTGVDAEAIAQEEGDRIVVTGSRIRRDQFSSISPLQVIDAGDARLTGAFDTTSIIAQSPLVAGAQLDSSVNAGSPTAAVEGVPASGVGSSTVALRGLGAERTLLLVNGRRLSPSGVRGAPVAPDLNTIPSGLVERIDVLTDGASAVYGADAVAGVVNIILRDDFEGLEVNAFATQPFDEGGDELQVSFLGGASTDRSNFTVAAEYYSRTAVLAGDRDFNDCLRDIDIADTGEIFSVCFDGRPDNAALIGSAGFIFNTPGSTNIGVDGWTTTAGLPFNFRTGRDYNLQDEEDATQLLGGFDRVSLYSTGHFDIDFWERDRFYFELSYNNRSSIERFTSEQVFPGVPGFIPQVDADGNVVVDGSGQRVLVDNPLNPFGEDALPVISLADLAQRRSTNVDVFRAVGGLEGDLAIGPLFERNWVYDVSISYDRSDGTASQPILFENNLRESLDTLFFNQATGEVECGLERTALSFGFITPNPCVPVNFFSPTLFTTQGGDKTFATEAERDFLFGTSINTTEIEQVLVSAFATGDLFELPGGTAGLVVGGEFREQRINSVNDIARTQGLAASEVPDTERDTIGRTSLAEFFVETELPLHETFLLSAAGRFTEEENFGAQVTYSVKADFAPTEALRFRGTYGTTFRAPNLREQFLAGSAGTIGGGNDPCIVPAIAQDENNNYLPDLDDRPQVVLDNCVLSGADPTALGLLGVTGIPTTTGGSTDLQAETSDSYTFGVDFRQPWFDEFVLDVSLTYFDVEVNDTVEESNPAEILARCFNDEPNLASPFCSRISRNLGNPATATIANVDASFINVGLVTSTGVDFTVRYQNDLDFLGGSTFGVILNGTHLIEQLEQIDPDSPIDDNVGEIAVPEWRFNTTATLDKGPWTALWRVRYIDDFQQDDSDAFVTPSATGTACGILGVAPGVTCRDVDFGDSVIYNDASLTYTRDSWTATFGVSNLFNTEPPLIDQGEGPSRQNIVVQSGYDLIGRRVFLGLTKSF